MLRRVIIFIALCSPYFLAAQEVCNNGVDDDNDGAIDLNDSDCVCSTLLDPGNAPSFIHNHSFEEQVMTPIVVGSDTIGEYACCPYGWSTPPENWLDCSVNWRQATLATSDYYNACGFYPATYPFPPPDGVAAVGFIPLQSYKEYVGTCLMLPETDPHPLLPGVTYTLSLWISLFAATTVTYNPPMLATYDVFYEDPFPLVIFGSTSCEPFPLITEDCVGYLPGWNEIARVYHQPNGQWERVSMTFTPDVEIRSVIIGSACDLPLSYDVAFGSIQGPDGMVDATPYVLVDDLILTEADDQVLTPVYNVGSVCADDVVVTASPPIGASGHQWYRDGVAIVGQTALVLNASALGLGSGTYALASTFNGECLMGTTNVAEPTLPYPRFSLYPGLGCAPLEVAFADTTSPISANSTWSFGDGGQAVGPTVTHVYNAPGVYDVTLTVTSSLGCSKDSTLIGAVVVEQPAIGVISAFPNPTDVANTSITLNAAGSTGPIVSWWWVMEDAAPPTSDQAATVVDLPPVPGVYPVLLVVRTAVGCLDTVRSEVVVRLSGDIEMPNVFTPNGDGSNDRFLPLDIAGANGQLDIYNRWGELLFTTTNMDHGWNGEHDGSGVPDGTYYYVVTPTETEAQPRSGHVTLVR